MDHTISKNDILQTIIKNDDLIAIISEKLSVSKELIIATISGKSNKSDNKVVLFIDGGSRGNPGISGSGVVLDVDGQKTGYYFYEGTGTNNEAEYKGLINGLKIAIENGIGSVTAYSDSELVCRQIKGQYKVKSETILPLFREAGELIDRFDFFELNHIPREQNKDADRMANLAMDKKINGRVELTVAAD